MYNTRSIEHVEITKNNAKSCTINIEVPGVNMFITEVEVCMYDNTGTIRYIGVHALYIHHGGVEVHACMCMHWDHTIIHT